MIKRLALALAIVTGVSVTAGAAAVLPIGKSAPLQVIESDAPTPPSTTTTPTTDPDDPIDRGHKVWVCVMLAVGNGDGWELKPGANPIEVAAVSQIARDAEDPDHPSYVASSGEEHCTLPTG